MAIGVNGFVPGRLTMAREARALRQNELADLVGRTAGTISKWESLEQTQRPEPAVLPQLAQTLRVDVDWFLKPLPKGHETASFFRSLVSELEIMRGKAKARLGFVEAIEDALSKYIDFPDVDVPDFLNGQDFESIRREDIEYVASSLRGHWDIGDGPVDDLLLLVENAGVIVAEDHIGSIKLDGLSKWSRDGEKPFMLLAQDKRVGVRRRFDAAHELGHLVLHRNVSASQLSKNFKLIEEQAMMFAGAFLLPASSYEDDIFSLSLEAMLDAKRRWKVSVAAQIKRLAALDKFSADYERRLWQYYSYRKWRAFEPLDDEFEVEAPVNLKEAIEAIVDGNVQSPSGLRREIGLPTEDISSLTGVAATYVADPVSLVPRRKLKFRSEGEISAFDETNIVPFDIKKRKFEL